MELIRGLTNIKPHHAGCVLTIGKFDGVHLGHKAVIKTLLEKSAGLNLPSTVMVFEPHPEEVFRPDNAPARLTRWPDKYQLLKDCNIDRLILMRFNKAFASLSAESFVRELLVEKLGVKFLVIGDDFRFGDCRSGDFEMLKESGRKFGFEVLDTKSCLVHDCRISSSAIRNAVAKNDFELAEEMLGHKFVFTGKVFHGDKKGRTIGFPTANIALNRCVSPLRGVFAVEIAINNQHYKGVANIGMRPTVDGQRHQLEVHIFDFSGDLYGQKIGVYPRKQIREEMKFSSLDELKHQIEQDAEQARSFFNV